MFTVIAMLFMAAGIIHLMDNAELEALDFSINGKDGPVTFDEAFYFVVVTFSTVG